jgi:hypothetical protein
MNLESRQRTRAREVKKGKTQMRLIKGSEERETRLDRRWDRLRRVGGQKGREKHRRREEHLELETELEVSRER